MDYVTGNNKLTYYLNTLMIKQPLLRYYWTDGKQKYEILEMNVNYEIQVSGLKDDSAFLILLYIIAKQQ